MMMSGSHVSRTFHNNSFLACMLWMFVVRTNVPKVTVTDSDNPPWMDKEDCRYVFTADWTDLNNIVALFPEMGADLKEQFAKLSVDSYVPDVYDEGTQVEDYKKYLSSGHWVNGERNRVRPIEMWYTHITKSWFAVMPNGRVLDLDSISDVNQKYQNLVLVIFS